jgi:anti-sigma B factor antagonist
MLATMEQRTMTEIPKGICVGAAGTEVHVRVMGRGTFQNGQTLRRYAFEMMDRGSGEFFVDLSRCQGMDSTFLGVLAGIGLRLVQTGRAGKVHIVNVGARNLELLQTLGLDRLFAINTTDNLRTQNPVPADADLQQLPESDLTETARLLSKHDTADLMLEAHDYLIRADQRNLAKFKDLTQFLRKNATKHTADAPPVPSSQRSQT